MSGIECVPQKETVRVDWLSSKVSDWLCLTGTKQLNTEPVASLSGSVFGLGVRAHDQRVAGYLIHANDRAGFNSFPLSSARAFPRAPLRFDN